MSLDWDVSEIENWEAVVKIPVNPDWTAEELRSIEYNHTTWEDDDGKITHYMNPITNTLIWGSMLHGFRKITKDNYHEVWLRLAMDDAVSGRGRIYDFKADFPGYRSVSIEEIYAHIGLGTNASSVSKTEFYNRLLKTANDKKRRHEIVIQQQPKVA
jgi:hypothetical protein